MPQKSRGGRKSDGDTGEDNILVLCHVTLEVRDLYYGLLICGTCGIYVTVTIIRNSCKYQEKKCRHIRQYQFIFEYYFFVLFFIFSLVLF